VQTWIRGAMGIPYPAPEWLAACKAFPLPGLVALVFADGEIFEPSLAGYGEGDADTCEMHFGAMLDRQASERAAYAAMCEERAAEYAAMVANASGDALQVAA